MWLLFALPDRPVYTAPEVIRLALSLVAVVSIAFVVTAPVPLPIRAAPEVSEVAPVPPFETGRVPLILDTERVPLKLVAETVLA